MPTGVILGQTIALEPLPRTGTLGPYEGTIVSIQPPAGTIGATSATLTVVGGVLIKANALTELDTVALSEIGLQPSTSATIVSGKIVGFGKKLGTVTGSFLGTVVADSNHILLKLFQVGTVSVGGIMPLTEPAVGSQIVGSVMVIEVGR